MSELYLSGGVWEDGLGYVSAPALVPVDTVSKSVCLLGMGYFQWLTSMGWEKNRVQGHSRICHPLAGNVFIVNTNTGTGLFYSDCVADCTQAMPRQQHI